MKSCCACQDGLIDAVDKGKEENYEANNPLMDLCRVGSEKCLKRGLSFHASTVHLDRLALFLPLLLIYLSCLICFVSFGVCQSAWTSSNEATNE